MDRGRDVRFVCCDVSKAFDKVWHTGLLFKLKQTGVNKQLISWIESYLADRQQKVVSDGFSSTVKGIKAGVPCQRTWKHHNKQIVHPSPYPYY
jgi:hypothetical protein